MYNIKLIAETAWHHEGDFVFFKNLINNISNKTNTDFIKIHLTIDLDEYMNSDHELYSKLSKMKLSRAQYSEILQLIEEKNINKILLFNDSKAVDFGIRYNPEIIEIHSACLNDFHLLDSIKSNVNKNSKVMFGVGGATLYEIEKAISRIGTENIILMHGFQNYPTIYADINFSKIKKLMNLYPDFEHGYADHTAWNEPNNIMITLMGASLGMDYIEKHVTNEYGKERIDYTAAISFDMFNELQDKLNLLSKCYGNGLLEMNEGEKSYSIFGPMKKVALLSSEVRKGETMNENNIYFKRTSQTSELTQIDILDLIGCRFNSDYPKNTLLTKNMLEK